MHLNWRQRLEQQPGLRAFARWPMIPPETLPRHRRRAFLRNQQIVAQALQGGVLKHVAAQHDVTPARVSQLLERCLGGEAEAPPALTAGLIPHHNLAVRTRARPLPTHAQPRGNACAFKALLTAAPAIREGLDQMIEAKLGDKPYAQRIAPQDLHGEFKRLLAEIHWPQDQYPYTTASVGYQALRRYTQQRILELQQARTEKPAPPRVRDVGLRKRLYRALRAIQIDEHILDLNDQLLLGLNDELIALRLARANLLVAREVDMECVLGYHLAPTRHPNQQDLLTLFANCLLPWQPLELQTPGLQYTPGACFPSGLQEAFPISFGTVQLDNALMHRAQSVVDLLCERWGATLNLGRPALPKQRWLVEAVFDYINTHGTHRFAATTGSHPSDPARESRKNRKQPPAVAFQTLNELCSVLLTEANVTPQATLGNAAPLELLQYDCANHFVRFVPPLLSQQWHPLIDSRVVRLHWHTRERRAPHVNFYYARYQGAGLARIASRETWIRVVFDRRDLRTLQAFTLEGEALGALHAPVSWQRFPHTLATRQWIYKHTQQYRFNARDPLSSYFRWLLDHKGKPAVALSLLRVYTEFTAGQSGALVLGEDPPPPGPQTDAPHVWRPELAYHGD